MNNEWPFVAVMLKAHAADIKSELSSQAYSLEMQIDNEWHCQCVLLTPSGYLRAITVETGVTGEDTEIVSAGITSLPAGPAATSLQELDHPQNNWLLLGQPGGATSVAEGLLPAVQAGCRVIACLDPLDPPKLFNTLKKLPAEYGPQVSVAYLAADVKDVATLRQHVQKIQEHLQKFLPLQPARLLISGKVDRHNAATLLAIPGVQGFLLRDQDYDDVCGDILYLLAALGRASSDE